MQSPSTEGQVEIKFRREKTVRIQVAAFGLKNDLLLTRDVDKGWATPITLISRTR
jgi:hypothetical protein